MSKYIKHGNKLEKRITSTINSKIEEFFQTLAFTKVYDKAERRILNEQEANTELIKCAPDMLRTICWTYLYLLINMPSEIRNTIDGQLQLSILRDQIACATDKDSIEIDSTFEHYRIELAVNSGAVP